MKKIFIDLDNTLANFSKRAAELGLTPNEAKKTAGFFESLEPMTDAIESFNLLCEHFDVYILSTSPWSNPMAMYEKAMWVKKFLPKAYKRVIFSHHKNLCVGDYLIDDMPKHGAKEFVGEWIQFGSEKFPNWNSVVNYLMNN